MLKSCRSLWVGSAVIALLPNVVFSQGVPDNWKDAFLSGSGGRPTLGTTGATCWARGGVCVDIRECPWLEFDGNVPGCMRGFKICCKVAKQLSPSVGHTRRNSKMPIYSSNLQELDQEMLTPMGRNNLNYLGTVAITDQ